MSDLLADLRYQLAIANRMLAHEGVLDAFGHVSVRHPTDKNRYFLPRSRSPELIEPADILEFHLDSQPVTPPKAQMYSERVIHGEIYKARPDVMAVCHHHSRSIMPFCITGEPLVPVFHLGATIGPHVPFWDSQDDFGDTNLLVCKPEEGASLAKTLAKYPMVLLRRHGAAVVGKSLNELVFRCIVSCQNADYLNAARNMGTVGPLTPGEVRMAGALMDIPSVPVRTWEFWLTRLANRGAMPPRAAAKRAAPAKASATKMTRKPARPAKTPAKTKAAAKKTSAKSAKAKGRNKR